MSEENKRMKKKHHKGLWITLISIVSVILIVFIVFFIYAGNYYHANEKAKEALKSDNTIKVENLEGTEDTVFIPEDKNEVKAGFIFYPGGKVEEIAYAPLLKDIAEEGFVSVLIPMPFRLAVLGMNRADGVINKIETDYNLDLDFWAIGGHSLGGAMSASYVSKHLDEYQGLALFGAYSTADLSSSNLKVMTFYGTEDKVMKKDNYNEDKKNLPRNFSENIIEGGCHSYFGNYGHQKGDGNPTITAEEQQSFVAKAMKNYFLTSL